MGPGDKSLQRAQSFFQSFFLAAKLETTQTAPTLAKTESAPGPARADHHFSFRTWVAMDGAGSKNSKLVAELLVRMNLLQPSFWCSSHPISSHSRWETLAMTGTCPVPFPLTRGSTPPSPCSFIAFPTCLVPRSAATSSRPRQSLPLLPIWRRIPAKTRLLGPYSLSGVILTGC